MSIFVIIFGLIIFLCAYSMGKRKGYQSGFEAGKASMVLELREQSLIEGCCFFCKNDKRDHTERVT